MRIDGMNFCKFCTSERVKYFSAQERMLGLAGDFNYAECETCGSIQLVFIPEDLSVYYPPSYYSFIGLNVSSLQTRILKGIRMRLFLWLGMEWQSPMYGYWLKKVHPGFSARIADVGCGNGQLLYELYCGGYSDLHGFDPFIEQENQLAPGLMLWKKRIEDSDLTFDLIMMHHAFEHMEDPTQVLKSCYDKLNPGGKLLIRCPVADAAVWKEKRVFWVQLDAPRHLIIPTVSGFKSKAESLGFTLDEVEFDSSDFQFWATALYEQGEILNEHKTKVLFSPEERKMLKEKARQYNQEGKGDQVCFYLSKPKS
jgi:SAM-dependent methyltransferase